MRGETGGGVSAEACARGAGVGGGLVVAACEKGGGGGTNAPRPVRAGALDLF